MASKSKGCDIIDHNCGLHGPDDKGSLLFGRYELTCDQVRELYEEFYKANATCF